jgi:hypothetical protein
MLTFSVFEEIGGSVFEDIGGGYFESWKIPHSPFTTPGLGRIIPRYPHISPPF